MSDYSYDPACGELANYFLADESKRLASRSDELAQHIQDAIEAWFFTANHEENTYP